MRRKYFLNNEVFKQISFFLDMQLLNFEEKCIKCGACIEECPASVITIDILEENQKSYPYAKCPFLCIDCGHCVAICPVNACIHDKLPLDQFISIEEKTPVAFEQFEKLVRKRRSIRTFKKEQINVEEIKEILNKICRYAPTGGNSQTISYKLLVNEDVEKIAKKMNSIFKTGYRLLNILFFLNLSKAMRENRKKLKAIIQAYESGKDPYCRGAPAILLVLTNKGYATSFEDGIIAADHFVLAAETKGLGTCYFGFLQKLIGISRSLKKLLKIPKRKKMCYSILVGYPKYQYKRTVARNELKFEN